MNTEVNLADRRIHSRIESLDQPVAAINEEDTNLCFHARILDISLGGARMQVDHQIAAERNVVEVLIDGIKAVAEIVWRTSTEIGLRYIDQAENAAINIFEQIITREFRRKSAVAG